MTIKINIERKHLAALAIVAKLAAKDYRTYLDAVYLDPTGYMVATDGKVLLAIENDETKALVGHISSTYGQEGLLIPRQTLELIIKSKDLEVQLIIEDGNYQFFSNEFVSGLPFIPLKDHYPEWKRMYTSIGDEIPSVYMIDQLNILSKISKTILGNKFGDNYQIHQNGINPSPFALIKEGKVIDGISGMIVPRPKGLVVDIKKDYMKP